MKGGFRLLLGRLGWLMGIAPAAPCACPTGGAMSTYFIPPRFDRVTQRAEYSQLADTCLPKQIADAGANNCPTIA